MVAVDAYKEWRGFTPILLVCISILGAITTYFVIDKLNAMTDMSKNTYALIGEVRTDLADYKTESGEHFAKIDQELIDFKPK